MADFTQYGHHRFFLPLVHHGDRPTELHAVPKLGSEAPGSPRMPPIHDSLHSLLDLGGIVFHIAVPWAEDWLKQRWGNEE